MRGATKIFRVFGIDIKIHYSWWLVFIFLSWALTTGFFPLEFPGYTSKEYWFMGVTAALLLFVSVLLHELSHSLVAKARKIKVQNITLFFFGGVAGITDEDMKPSSEFLMAIAGPLFSLVLSGICYLVFRSNINGLLTPIFYYLALINIILAAFNSVPGFPLDGGRAFRAILYAYYKDLKKATKIAVSVGRFFAIFLIIIGVLGLISGAGGLWFILIGGFLYFVAGLSYEQVVLKETLAKISVVDLISKKVSLLDPKMKFTDFVKKQIDSGEEVFIVKDKNFSGILDLRAIGKIPKEMQRTLSIKQVAIPLSKMKVLHQKDNAYTAFKKFEEQGAELLPVMEDSKLLGFVNRKTVMHRLIWSLKYGLEDFTLKKAIKKVVKKAVRKKEKIVKKRTQKGNKKRAKLKS
ncbi:MAG: site-2 protease family protein [Nanoarchaeota archaeon]|nr:site-2 protease family protein [Nanoarchaeota archaeon]MBU1644333.1 site-2 protease family protein [Nanoarchaeota archaeon]MBU1976344.1 site-2 protease family protein [Nanoarchaeota archaeon]